MNSFKFGKFGFWIDKSHIKYILLLAVSGSHAYGWDTEKSDLDVRNVYFPNIQQALSIFYGANTKQFIADNIDHTEYPIRQFLMLLAKGNGNVADNLFEASDKNLGLYVDTAKVKQLQKMVLSHLHMGFLLHCIGYDTHLKKDMENETRLRKYGKQKLLLNRYKILLEGLILASHGEVVYNVRKQHEYIKTNWCIELLEAYQSGQPFLGSRANQEALREVEQLHNKLAEMITSIKWPTSDQSTLDLVLDKWHINHYTK